jgi:hypothetical protein
VGFGSAQVEVEAGARAGWLTVAIPLGPTLHCLTSHNMNDVDSVSDIPETSEGTPRYAVQNSALLALPHEILFAILVALGTEDVHSLLAASTTCRDLHALLYVRHPAQPGYARCVADARTTTGYGAAWPSRHTTTPNTRAPTPTRPKSTGRRASSRAPSAPRFS